MRFVRIPYMYLPDNQLISIRSLSIFLLNTIRDVHLGIPNENWKNPFVKAYMYHPIFIRWVFAKSQTELGRRGRNKVAPLANSILSLKSKSLEDFIPPTDFELSEDVVWLLEQWQYRYRPGGIHLPQSYVDLVRIQHGYTPKKAAYERIDQSAGHHRDSDREWYYCQGEEKTQVFGNPVEQGIRFCGDERRK